MSYRLSVLSLTAWAVAFMAVAWVLARLCV